MTLVRSVLCRGGYNSRFRGNDVGAFGRACTISRRRSRADPSSTYPGSGGDDAKAIVAAILDGDRSRVRELPFTAGALLMFAGRQTLHRVTRVSGARPRLVPVLAYSERPGLANSDEVRMRFWGRTGKLSGRCVHFSPQLPSRSAVALPLVDTAHLGVAVRRKPVARKGAKGWNSLEDLYALDAA